MIMMPDLEDLLMVERFDPNVRDESTVYVGEWDEYYYTDSDDEGDENQKPEVWGTMLDTNLIYRDGDEIDMGIKDEASARNSSEKLMSEGDVEPMEEDKSAATKAADGDALEEDTSSDVKKKKEKRKSQENGVESEQNGGVETDIEGKKKKKSLSISDA